MKKIICLTSLLCASTVMSVPAFAISVTEPTGVGFNAFLTYPWVDLGTLALGTNTVAGSLMASCVYSGFVDCNPGNNSEDSQDSFYIHVGAGDQIDSLLVSTSNVSGPAGFSASFSVNDPINNNQIAGDAFLPLGSTSPNIALIPLGSGKYAFGVYGQQATSAGNYSLDYNIAVNVSAVPVPAAGWLFSSGLLGLVSVARRKAA